MIEIVQQAFEPYTMLQEFQAQLDLRSLGANAVFVGTMRDFNENDQVSRMLLEHYPGMTEKVLQEICDQAAADWPLEAVLVVHRVGQILPGEAIVLVAVWTAHRAEAFAACRYIIEALKSRAPFWKKETLPGGERWVQKNT